MDHGEGDKKRTLSETNMQKCSCEGQGVSEHRIVPKSFKWALLVKYTV